MKLSSFNFFTNLFTAILVLSMITFTSCNKDDDDKNNEPRVEDGIYVSGDATGFNGLVLDGLMEDGREEGEGFASNLRPDMYEKFLYLNAGNFNITEVSGATRNVYGWKTGTNSTIDPEGAEDQIRGPYQRGEFEVNGATFNAPSAGFYHLVMDRNSGLFFIVKIEKWGVIGDATDSGWAGEVDMPLKSLNATDAEWSVEKVVLRNRGGIKFRYNNGWKINAGDFFFFANIGKNATNGFITGGDAFPSSAEGEFTISLKWNIKTGWSYSTTKTGDVEPLPVYPELMYIVGAATAYGWDEPGTKDNAVMQRTAGGSDTEGIFWKICHIEGGQGFKISAAKWANPNLGFGQVTEFDAEGVTVSEDGGNMKVDASGMYMVVLNLRDNKVKVSIKPAEVYGIGTAFGTWDAGVAAQKFTVNDADKTLVSPALISGDAMRMYAAHSWIPAWWNAEFRVNDGKIDYRGDGGDQGAVSGAAGQKVTLKFDDNTGSIQ